MATMLGSLLVSLGLESGQFKSGLSAAEKDLKKATKDIEAMGARMQGLGETLSTTVTPALIGLAGVAVKGASDQAQAMAQVDAALKSMGGASGKTSAELLKMSDALEMNSLIDGDVILRDITANLLTFGNIAGDVFDKAQQAAVDMAARLGSDPKGAAIMLGKALNDPIKGITALTRVGVSFTAQQQAQIKAMAEAGDVAGAQGLILAELEKQYGGAAKAAADTSPWRTLQVAIGQVGDVIGEILLPFVREASESLAGFATWFKDLSPGVQSAAVALGALAAAAGPVLMAVGMMVQGMAPFIAAISAIGSSGGIVVAAQAAFAGLTAALGPVLIPIAAVAAAGALIYANWDKIGPLQSALGPKVTGLIETIKTTLTDLWNGPFGAAIKQVMNALVEWNVILMKVMGPVVITIITTLIDVFETAFKNMGLILTAIGQVLSGDFAGAWKSIQQVVANSTATILKIFGNLWEGIKSIAANFGVNLVQIGRDMIAGLARGITNAASLVWNALKGVVLSGINNVKAFLGIKSPSRLFMEMGSFVAEGFAIGITNETPRVVAAIRAMGVAASDEMRKSLDGLAKYADDAQSVFDRLFPEDVKRRNYFADKAIIALAPGRSAAEKAAAQSRLSEEYLGDFAGAVYGKFQKRQDEQFTKLQGQFAKLGKAARTDLQNPVVRAVEVMARSVQDAATAIGNALRGIGDAFKNGGFWDKLGAIADLVGVAANAYGNISGLFKSSGGNAAMSGAISNAVKNFGGARANGGPVGAGKSYLVGERGPEIFMPRGSGSIVPNHAMGGTTRVEIVDTTGLFETRVTQTAASVTGAGIGALESRRSFGSRRAIG